MLGVTFRIDVAYAEPEGGVIHTSYQGLLA